MRVELAKVLVDCIENPEVLGRVLLNVAESFGAGFDLSLAEATCTMDEVIADADQPARLLVGVAPLAGDVEVLYQAFEECLSPENLAVAMGQEGAGPQAYGDNERLDSMQEDCEAGELRACDLLYVLVRSGHDLENVGYTCGGRIAVGAIPDCRTRLG